jgi:ABC-2 type transport system permease protein
MKTGLLFVDELRGFYKSKVMVFLWIGLPIITLLFRFISAGSSAQNISFTLISALIVSSIGGTLASVMLAVFIINEKNRHVYDLFLIRPLKRRDIILAKFFSVYICVAIASFSAIFAGMMTDYVTTGALSTVVLSNVGQSLVTSLSMIAVSCAAGVLIGVASPSVLVGTILVIYGGNQISVIPLIPNILNIQEATIFTILLAGTVASGLLLTAVSLFERKQF